VTPLSKVIFLGFAHQPSFIKPLHFLDLSMVWKRCFVHLKVEMEPISKT
jgi:hypothetical protein